MKSIICVYIVGFLLWAVFLWFDSILQVPFFFLFVAGMVFAIFFAARNLKREKICRNRLTAVVPLVIVMSGTVLLFLPFTDWKVRVDHCFFREQRLKAMEEVMRLNPRVNGNVTLPHWWLSANGTAYIYDSEPNRLLVGFPATVGLLSPSWMVVYSAQDRPLTGRELQYGEVRIFEKLSPHWYYLQCR